jgi:hypothetical protein
MEEPLYRCTRSALTDLCFIWDSILAQRHAKREPVGPTNLERSYHHHSTASHGADALFIS